MIDGQLVNVIVSTVDVRLGKKWWIFHDMVLAISNPLCYVASFSSLDQGLLVIAWNSCVILSFKGPVDRMFIGFLCVP